MIRLIYKSVSPTDMSAQDISGILSVARRNNAKDEITGMLIYKNRQFLQVLEGEAGKVEACYARVARDPRHSQIEVLSRCPARSRTFTKWLMGYENPKDLGLLAQQSALTIGQIQERLDAVAHVNTTAGRKETIRQMSLFLLQTQMAANVA